MYEKLSKLRLVLFVNPRFWLESKILSIIECDIMYQLVILVWPSCQQTLVGAARAVRALRAVWPGPGSSQVVQLLLLSDLSPCQPGHSQKSQLRRDTSASLSSSSAPPQLLNFLAPELLCFGVPELYTASELPSSSKILSF